MIEKKLQIKGKYIALSSHSASKTIYSILLN